MESFDGMDVQHDLGTEQPGVALCEDVGGDAFGQHSRLAAREDVVVDEVGKERHLGRDKG